MALPVRSALIDALQADLIGPFDLSGSTPEVLPLPPSRWYLTGSLAPLGDRETHDPTADDEGGAGSSEDDDDDADTQEQEPEPKQKKRYPASMGLSVLLPAKAGDAETIDVTVRFAEYVLDEVKEPGAKRSKRVWRRMARRPFTVAPPLDAKKLRAGVSVPDSTHVKLQGEIADAGAPGLLPGTRALSVFLVNDRSEGEKGRQDERSCNRLKDPACDEPRILELRGLREEMDRAVLDAYGWTEVAAPLFCPMTPEEQKALQASRDEVLDRLFVLNAERASEAGI